MNKIKLQAKENQRHRNKEQTSSYKREGADGDWLNKSEGISQRTYMSDPWPWSIVRRIDCGNWEVAWVGGKVGKLGQVR